MMKFGKGLGKLARLMAALLLLTSILPGIVPEEAKAASGCQNVMVYQAEILNNCTNQSGWGKDEDYASDLAKYNMWRVFYGQDQSPSSYPGISGKTDDDRHTPGGDDQNYANQGGVYHVDGTWWGIIEVKKIPALKALAEGGSAKFRIKAFLNSTTSNGAYIWAYTSKTPEYVKFDYYEPEKTYSSNYNSSRSKFMGHSTKNEKDTTVTSGYLSFDVDDYIIIQTETPGGGTQVEDAVLSFGDFTDPVLTNYTFTSDGTERLNKEGQQQLFLKKDQSIQLKYNFSKPVRATMFNDKIFDKHLLYTVPPGYGLPTDNTQQGLSLPDGFYENSIKYNQGDVNSFRYIKQLPYTYKVAADHHTGNIPIGKNGELDTKTQNLYSMKERLEGAGYFDAAGNPLNMSGFNKASADSSRFLSNRTVNPFDYANANSTGYLIIVDALPPQYNLNGNGITPEMLTGLVLNEGKEIEFTVELNKDTIVQDGWSEDGLYLLFNNGMKAKYVAKENTGPNTRLWKFKMTIPAGANVETPLLKAIALTHEAKGTDTGVIQDYAGNLLMETANTDKPNPADPKKPKSTTKIDWANLSIDNTPPAVDFRYSSGGATGAVYAKSGKITIDANDPDLIVPALDPDKSVTKRPSKGIYRPGNMTGVKPGESPEVGLVYYTWSQSPADPFAGKEEDHFAAIKYYSLTAKQPGEGLYPGNTVTLKTANNKTNMIEPPAAALTAENSGAWYLHTWTADMTWDSARELAQYNKMKTFKAANAALFNGWVADYKSNHAGASDADALKYAEDKAMVEVGNYSEWPLDDFKKDDANWVYATGTLLLDNKKPSINFGTVSGNATPEVKVQVTATDEHSGVGTKQFQWVKQGEEPQDIDWLDVPASDEITTFNHVFGDGTYQLVVKAVDKAGNQAIEKMDTAVTVDSSVKVSAAFSPETNGSYMKSPEITFTINGINVESVRYAVTNTAAAPSDYPSVAQAVYGTEGGANSDTVSGAVYGPSSYLIAPDPSINGIYAVHVKVKEEGAERYYTYSKQYRVDNEAPEITFSKNGVSYPLEQQSVVVSVSDRLSGVAIKKYQWLRSGAPAPVKESGGWLDLPVDGAVTIDSTRLLPGEMDEFVLYVLGEDAVGNSKVTHTGTFKIARKAEAEIPAAGDSDLLYIYDDGGNGYTAVLKLNLENSVKEGYRYSLSTDGGSSWGRWLPYSNFIEVGGLKDRNPDHILLQAKFRSPGGAESAAVGLNSKTVSIDEPVYGIASHSTLRPVKPENFVLELKVPAGIRVVPQAGNNPSEPTRIKGNKFGIAKNGVYSFDLTDLTNSARKDTLVVVVDNLDGMPPEGSVEYSMTSKTSGNVIARLDTSKPVRILNNGGRSSYTFTENGSFTFMMEDEAGNSASVTAEVYNIDRTPPEAKIVRSYAYGENGSNTFKTIKDANGQVLMAQGVVLNVEKPNAQAKEFHIVRGTNGATVLLNGEVDFTIVDDAGNTSVISDQITNIIPFLADPESIKYEFVDDEGALIPDDRIVVIGGTKVAKGRVKVTISGHVQGPNQVFLGTAPASDGNGGYTNRISDEDGNYSYSRIFAANGQTYFTITDALGNLNKLPIVIQGIDNKPPVITLNKPIAFVEKNRPDFNVLSDLGGFTVSDDFSKPGSIVVEASGLDISRVGAQTVTYTAKDEAGNVSTVEQKVYVLPGDGLMILGNGELISAEQSEKVLFDTNVVTFQISKYNLMDVAGETLVNEWGTYDVFYQSGLYREGQMKYIAKGLSLNELLQKSFTVEFPKTGWYTLIVRTQEREREYTTFFIGNMFR